MTVIWNQWISWDELGWAQKSCPTERLCAIGSKVSFGFEIFVPLFKLLAIIVSTVVMFENICCVKIFESSVKN